MLAAQLARRGITSVLIEGGGRLGHGIAFSTDEPAHVLNVRSESMSAWPDDPDHFARETGDPRGFAQRRHFGRYLRSILDEAIASGRVEPIADMAVAAVREAGDWRIDLEDGGGVVARALVLAIGNQPPEPLNAVPAAAGERFINNPWGGGARAAVREAAASGGEVLLIGTGLTMIDTVLSLAAAGHRGRIVALSRRGQIPKAHAEFAAAPVEAGELPEGLLELWRWLRRRSGEVGWRAAVDSLRPHSHALWQGLSLAEQRRFLRHARPWWDAHRHRIAPEVARQIVDMVAGGRLDIVAGRIVGIREIEGALGVEIRRRGWPLTPLSCAESPSSSALRCSDVPQTFGAPRPSGGEGLGRFEFVFNCTGPLGAIGRSRDPMLRRMLDDGLVRPDRLGIGLEVDGRSRAAGAANLWALGPLTKGRYWEIVAVPDIRGQAAAVADDIASLLQPAVRAMREHKSNLPPDLVEGEPPAREALPGETLNPLPEKDYTQKQQPFCDGEENDPEIDGR